MGHRQPLLAICW